MKKQKQSTFLRPEITIDALVYTRESDGIRILLIQRGRPPFEGTWALPGGFVDYNELLIESCRRELYEETGLKDVTLNLFKIFDTPDRDPRHRTITVVFSVELNEEREVRGGDDAAEASWFSITELPEMAFDHRKIVDDFISQL